MAREDAILTASLGLALLTLFLISLAVTGFTSETVAAWLTGIGTAVLVGVAWSQLSAIRVTSRADFIHRLSADFFRPDTQKVLRALQQDDVTFNLRGPSQNFLTGSPDINFDALALDDYLLGPLESVGIFERSGIIDIEMAYDFFGWYVMFVWERPVVQEYVRWQRQQPSSADVYECLEQLYSKCRDVYARKTRGTSR